MPAINTPNLQSRPGASASIWIAVGGAPSGAYPSLFLPQGGTVPRIQLDRVGDGDWTSIELEYIAAMHMAVAAAFANWDVNVRVTDGVPTLSNFPKSVVVVLYRGVGIFQNPPGAAWSEGLYCFSPISQWPFVQGGVAKSSTWLAAYNCGAVIHELGHSLGLGHQSQYLTDGTYTEYGVGATDQISILGSNESRYGAAPIMGAGGGFFPLIAGDGDFARRILWYDGEVNAGTILPRQYDLYRIDKAVNRRNENRQSRRVVLADNTTWSSATESSLWANLAYLPAGIVPPEHVLERDRDINTYEVVVTAPGILTVTATPPTILPQADLALRLYDPSGLLVASTTGSAWPPDPFQSQGDGQRVLNAAVSLGRYTVVVTSATHRYGNCGPYRIAMSRTGASTGTDGSEVPLAVPVLLGVTVTETDSRGRVDVAMVWSRAPLTTAGIGAMVNSGKRQYSLAGVTPIQTSNVLRYTGLTGTQSNVAASVSVPVGAFSFATLGYGSTLAITPTVVLWGGPSVQLSVTLDSNGLSATTAVSNAGNPTPAPTLSLTGTRATLYGDNKISFTQSTVYTVTATTTDINGLTDTATFSGTYTRPEGIPVVHITSVGLSVKSEGNGVFRGIARITFDTDITEPNGDLSSSADVANLIQFGIDGDDPATYGESYIIDTLTKINARTIEMSWLSLSLGRQFSQPLYLGVIGNAAWTAPWTVFAGGAQLGNPLVLPVTGGGGVGIWGS